MSCKETLQRMQCENKFNLGTVTCSGGVRRVSDKKLAKSLRSAVRRHKNDAGDIKER